MAAACILPGIDTQRGVELLCQTRPMPDGVLRVAQLNAGSFLEPDWEERRHEIVSWIDHLRPDVVCLQEIWQSDGSANTAGSVAESLAEPMAWVFGGHPAKGFSSDPTFRFGSAVLSRFEIESHTLFDLGPADAADPIVRSIGWELLHAHTAGLDVFSTHLAPAPSHGVYRVAQVRAIDAHIRRIRGSADDLRGFGMPRTTMPSILCGDFNAEPDSDEIRWLCGLTSFEGDTTFHQDAWRVAGEGPGLTQDWRDNYIAAGLNVHRKRIDYVFVGDPFLREGNAGRVLSARLGFHEPRTGIAASDHRGLVVDIAWPTRPSD